MSASHEVPSPLQRSLAALRLPEAANFGRSRSGVQRPCGFPPANVFTEFRPFRPDSPETAGIHRSAFAARLDHSPWLSVCRGVPGRWRASHSLAGPHRAPAALMGFGPSQSCSCPAARCHRTARPTCRFPRRPPEGILPCWASRSICVNQPSGWQGYAARLLGLPPDKPCPLIAITGRYCPGLCSSSRSSNAAAVVAFLRLWLATRWPGLDTLASRQSPGTASGPIRPWASWRGCHLPFGVLQGLASRSVPVRIATGTSPCLRFSHPARRWASNALTR